jgi:hypothetical protein
MHRHIDKYTTRPGGILNEKARRVVLIASLTADDGRSADSTLLGLIEGIAIGLVESAGKATHDLKVRSLLGFGNDLTALEDQSD